MRVIVTYSECAFLFNEIENYSPNNNRSDGGIQQKKSGSNRTTLNLSAQDRIMLCPE